MWRIGWALGGVLVACAIIAAAVVLLGLPTPYGVREHPGSRPAPTVYHGVDPDGVSWTCGPGLGDRACGA